MRTNGEEEKGSREMVHLSLAQPLVQAQSNAHREMQYALVQGQSRFAVVKVDGCSASWAKRRNGPIMASSSHT